ANDPRASTIPGTEENLEESMLLAPMLFEDQVLGVLVLAKLGLHQFSDDDLRLLVIYASFAAQAMANADATERLSQKSAALERQLRSQADLRVNLFRDVEPQHGSLICVPLRGREGATGVLTLERLGVNNRFEDSEFELVKLFAAQVSIALQNAEAHSAVEVRARTDDLTG